MIVKGIVPLNFYSSRQNKAFQNNRVSNQNQPSFKARKFGVSLVYSEHFFAKCKKLYKLAESVILQEKNADIDALKKQANLNILLKVEKVII